MYISQDFLSCGYHLPENNSALCARMLQATHQIYCILSKAVQNFPDSYIVHCSAIISKWCSQALWSIFSLTALFSHQHLVSIAIVKFGLNELHHCREHGLFKAHTLLRWQSFTIFMEQKLDFLAFSFIANAT